MQPISYYRTVSYQELKVPVADGLLSVIDHGGDGPDVLLVHSLGLSAQHWSILVDQLRHWCHPYALDLRGHGQTTAALTDFSQPWQDIVQVTRDLGLDQPMLVGHDTGGYHAVAAAVTDPELFRAVVAIGGLMARSPEEVVDSLEYAQSTEGLAMMAERFHFGATGRGEDSRRELVERVLADAENDWIIGQLTNLASDVEWSVQELPDGTWVHLPTPQTVATGHAIPPDTPFFPGLRLLDQVRCLTWLVLPLDGFDADLRDRVQHLAGRSAYLSVVELEGGQYPQCSNAEALSAVLAAIANRVDVVLPPQAP